MIGRTKSQLIFVSFTSRNPSRRQNGATSLPIHIPWSKVLYMASFWCGEVINTTYGAPAANLPACCLLAASPPGIPAITPPPQAASPLGQILYFWIFSNDNISLAWCVFIVCINISLCLKCVAHLCWVNMWRLVVFYSLNMSCHIGQNFPTRILNFLIWRYKWAFMVSKYRLFSFKREINPLSEICGLWNGVWWCWTKLLFFLYFIWWRLWFSV